MTRDIYEGRMYERKLECRLSHIFVALIMAMATVLAIGLVENYQNTPTRGCTKTPANFGYVEYNCKNGIGFFEGK